MFALTINFIIALALVGVPSYVFYRLGLSAGIQKGVRNQLMRELTMNGILQDAEDEEELELTDNTRQTTQHEFLTS